MARWAVRKRDGLWWVISGNGFMRHSTKSWDEAIHVAEVCWFISDSYRRAMDEQIADMPKVWLRWQT